MILFCRVSLYDVQAHHCCIWNFLIGQSQSFPNTDTLAHSLFGASTSEWRWSSFHRVSSNIRAFKSFFLMKHISTNDSENLRRLQLFLGPVRNQNSDEIPVKTKEKVTRIGNARYSTISGTGKGKPATKPLIYSALDLVSTFCVGVFQNQQIQPSRVFLNDPACVRKIQIQHILLILFEKQLLSQIGYLFRTQTSKAKWRASDVLIGTWIDSFSKLIFFWEFFATHFL